MALSFPSFSGRSLEGSEVSEESEVTLIHTGRQRSGRASLQFLPPPPSSSLHGVHTEVSH